MDEIDVCVVGAGPVGGTLACRLAEGGARVAVIDRADLPPMEHPDFDGRAYAVAAGSRRLLEAAGIWAKLPLPVCPIEDIRVSDGKVGRPASRLHLHFDHREAGDEPFGWMVEARSLRVALNAHLHALPGLRLHAPAEARVTRDGAGAIVDVSDGSRFRCKLVVAAEGRKSPLREAAGIRVTTVPYKQNGLVAAISHEKPHGNVALEHFLPAGPFAQLPMVGIEGEPNVSAIVWTEQAALAERLYATDDKIFAREIARRMGSHLGAIRPIGRRWQYKLSAMFAERYVDTRMVLVGDAAHGIHPIAGQGLNLGFRDVIALSELVLEATRSGGDAGAPALLAEYQRRRRGANLLMLGATDALDRLFSTDNPIVRSVRDLGIAGVERSSALKRLFVRQAMGAAPATPVVG